MKFLIFISFLILLASCSKDESYGTGSLSFSQDTVSFYTVYSEMGSSTQRFKIYNASGKKLNIESIELQNADRSGFSLIVDGERRTSFSNIEIAAKDSLLAFVQLNVPQQSVNEAVYLLDSIRFRVGAETQYVYLEAYGRNAYVIANKTIAQDTTLTGERPILVKGILKVNAGVTLRLEENTHLLFHSKAGMEIDGTIDVAGTVAKPVVMKNDRTDWLDNSVPYELIPGQWEGLRFTGKSYDNILTNLQVYNAVSGLIFDESDSQLLKAKLKNVIVQNTSQSGLQMINCKIDAENCLFANSGGAALTVLGGDYIFIHCTVANYYAWGVRKYPTLRLGDNYNQKVYPLLRCDFVNSIVYGHYTNELDVDFSNANNAYFFRNSLIKGLAQTGSQFVNVGWNLDPLFVDNGNQNGLTFNFKLTDKSPARGQADKNYSSLIPFDLYGNSRMADGEPDVGCLEFIP